MFWNGTPETTGHKLKVKQREKMFICQRNKEDYLATGKFGTEESLSSRTN